MPDLTTGTITFLFTDIEGSTKLWEQYPDAMRTALTRHDQLLRQAIEENNGVVVKSTGDGVLAAFATAPDGLAAALALQQSVISEPWPDQTPIRVRVALHVGAAEYRDGDYYGSALNRAARLMATGHGEQVLLSQATYELVRDCLPAAASLQNMGEHRLKDLLAPEQVWQLLHPSLPAEFPPLKSLDYLPTNLPRQMTSFIGREREMQEVKRLLPSTPLLTLLGTGGTGKTRLAMQVGADVLEGYKDGGWLVELAALSDPNLIPQTVATAVGLHEEAGRPLLQTVRDYLRNRQLLLILDNCEHLLDACARLADTLLKHCPHLTILATSREPLGTAGERPWRVPSLLTPGPTDLPVEEKDMAAVLMEYDACRLFVERAMVQRQDFALTRSNALVVAHLCQQLDGIPLAIELAAARVRSLSVEEINARLDNRFRLLTGGSRTALPRQQTLLNMIQWSFDLLNAQEKALLCRLSVFTGGWTLKAAEAVGSSDPVDDWEVLDLLTSLVDKSLVVTEPQDEHTRYSLLETVRQYAGDRLVESGEDGIVRERHQAFFVALAEEAEPQLKGSEATMWLHRLETELENLRAALEWDNQEAALRIAGALSRFWVVRGYYTEGRQWLANTLTSTEAQAHGPARAKALNGAGILADEQGDYASARTRLEECLAIRRELRDEAGIAASLGNLGLVAEEQGDYASARTLHEQSLEIKRELGDKRGIANSLGNQGLVAVSQGDYASARTLYEESLEIKRELGDKAGIANSLTGLGNVAVSQGDYASARTLYEQSLEIQRELGDKRGIANSLGNLGNVARAQGDYALARMLYQQNLAIRRELGDKAGIAKSLEAFAALAAVQEQTDRAVRLWAAAQRLREEIGAPQPPAEQEEYNRQMAAARQAIGEEAFSAAWAEGRAMTMEQAIEHALKVEAN